MDDKIIKFPAKYINYDVSISHELLIIRLQFGENPYIDVSPLEAKKLLVDGLVLADDSIEGLHLKFQNGFVFSAYRDDALEFLKAIYTGWEKLRKRFEEDLSDCKTLEDKMYYLDNHSGKERIRIPENLNILLDKNAFDVV